MIGTMVSLALPERLGSTPEDAAALRHDLLFEHDIEVHLHFFGNRLYIRVSAQIYNDMSDVEKLIRAVDSCSR
jgi:isopenicillin-N epimerase